MEARGGAPRSVGESRASSRATSRGSVRSGGSSGGSSGRSSGGGGGGGAGGNSSDMARRAAKRERDRKARATAAAAAQAEACAKEFKNAKNPVRKKELALLLGQLYGGALFRGAKALAWLEEAAIPNTRAEVLDVALGMEEAAFDAEAPHDAELRHELAAAEETQRGRLREAWLERGRLHLRRNGAPGNADPALRGGEGGAYDVALAAAALRRWLALGAAQERLPSLRLLRRLLAEAEAVEEAQAQLAATLPDDAALHLRHSLGALGDLRLGVCEELARHEPEGLAGLRETGTLFLRRGDLTEARQLAEYRAEAAHEPVWEDEGDLAVVLGGGTAGLGCRSSRGGHLTEAMVSRRPSTAGLGRPNSSSTGGVSEGSMHASSGTGMRSVGRRPSCATLTANEQMLATRK